MTCPALLMRNTTDDPKWTSSIYHDHVSWFPGGSYRSRSSFASTTRSGTSPPQPGPSMMSPIAKLLFDKISTAIPSEWLRGSVEALATASTDGRHIVIKAVNYREQRNILLVRLQGAGVPKNADAMLHTITARLSDSASLEHPDADLPGEFAVELREGLLRDSRARHRRRGRNPGRDQSPLDLTRAKFLKCGIFATRAGWFSRATGRWPAGKPLLIEPHRPV